MQRVKRNFRRKQRFDKPVKRKFSSKVVAMQPSKPKKGVWPTLVSGLQAFRFVRPHSFCRCARCFKRIEADKLCRCWQVAPETVALVSTQQNELQQQPTIENQVHETTFPGGDQKVAARHSDGGTANQPAEKPDAAIDQKKEAMRRRQAERERIAEAEKKRTEMARIFRQAESLRENEKLEAVKRREQADKAS